MEHTDWLIWEPSKPAPEEILDRPYAYIDRVYTRREFENAIVEYGELSKQLRERNCARHEADVRQFFDGLDFMREHSELIYADNELAKSNPLGFVRQRRLLLGMYHEHQITLEGMLRLWENGAWKCVCPECGAESYRYRATVVQTLCYCPECKKIFRNGYMGDEGKTAEAVHVQYPHTTQDAGVASSSAFRLDTKKDIRIVFGSSAEEDEKKKKQEQEKKSGGFKAFADSTRWYSELPHDEMIEKARLEGAKKHGKILAQLFEKIAEMKEELADTSPTKMQMFWETLNKKIEEAEKQNG